MAELSSQKPRRAKRPPPQATAQATAQPTAKSPATASRYVSTAVLNRDELIAIAAYYRAERRQFEPGHEVEDWLAAESEVDSRLLAQSGAHSPI